MSSTTQRNGVILSFVVLVITVEATHANLPRPDGRIVGGKNASILQFPYQVSIRKYGVHVCGGSIFHYLHVLSAAHCTTSGTASAYSIRAGTDIVNQGGVVIPVCSIKAHDKFFFNTMEGDIAIFTLCVPLKFNQKILPVALPDPWDTVKSGTIAVVSGWGYVTPEGGSARRLQATNIPVISSNVCNDLYGHTGITGNMICAGYVGRGGKDACQGDSGGPLLADGKLFGIVSWGYGCADPHFPGVYTNVAKYRAWIAHITGY